MMRPQSEPLATTALGALTLLAALLTGPPAAHAAGRGWDDLIDRLAADGVDRARAAAAFADPRMPAFTGLGFSLYPGESGALYRRMRSPGSVARARACRGRYAAEFQRAEQRSGVPASVLSAILHVETHCGLNTGRELVLYRVARLAMANQPANLNANLARHTRGTPRPRAARIEGQVRRRAAELEATFYPEVLATFRVSERLGIDPLALRGSGAGAFGLPQFLPSSYLRFGADGDGDGRVSLYDPADAISSAANYLRGHGWRPRLTRREQRRVIWAYNHSDPYIDTVLWLADHIERTHPSRPAVARR